jgi:hypothetical protein
MNLIERLRKINVSELSCIRETWGDILENLDMSKIKENLSSKVVIDDQYDEIRVMIHEYLPKDLVNIVALYGDELLNRPYIYKNSCLAIDSINHTEIRDYSHKEIDILQRHGSNAGSIHPEQNYSEVQYIVRQTPCHIRWLVEAYMEIITMNRSMNIFTPVSIVYFNKCYVPGFFITKLTFYDREISYLCANLLDPVKGYMKKIEDKIDGMTKDELIEHFRNVTLYSDMIDDTIYTIAREDYNEFSDIFHKII